MKQGWEKTLLIHMPDKGLAPRTKTLITRQITRFLKNGQMTESDSPKQNTRDGRCALEKISTPEVTGETQNKTRTRRVAHPPEWLKRTFKKRSDAEPWRGRRASGPRAGSGPRGHGADGPRPAPGRGCTKRGLSTTSWATTRGPPSDAGAQAR